MNLSILYTAGIRGDLDTLPRLFTFIKELRRDVSRFRPEDEDVMLCAVQPPEVRTLLLDLGDSCAPDIWHCAVTDGRSTLIALDAMGYTAANVSGQITPTSRAKLDENLLAMALVDEDHSWDNDGLLITSSGDLPDRPDRLHIVLTPSDNTRLDGRTLRLAPVRAGQVGTAYIGAADTIPTLAAHAIFNLPPNTPPDPTIAAAVDFITREARHYGGRGS